jgi:predicted transcriptional regulator of viral defense system
MNIAEIIAKDDYMLYIKTEDGKSGLFDVKPYLESEVFSPLRDRTEFERIRNGRYFVEWDCGADLSADTIEARWKMTSTGNTQ